MTSLFFSDPRCHPDPTPTTRRPFQALRLEPPTPAWLGALPPIVILSAFRSQPRRGAAQVPHLQLERILA